VIVLDSAGYGGVSIAKSVTIAAPGGVYAGISVFAGDGITIDAPGAVVLLRWLTINGLGGDYGVRFVQGAELRIESCNVSGMFVAAVDAHLDGGAMLSVRDSSMSANSQGAWLHGAGHASFDRVRFNGNSNKAILIEGMLDVASANIEVDGSEAGIGVTAGTVDTSVTVSRSRFAATCGGGLSIGGGATVISAMVTDTEFTQNGCSAGGVLVSSSGPAAARASLTRSTFSGSTDRTVGTAGASAVAYLDNLVFTGNPSVGFSISAAGGPIYTRLNNTVQGTSISANVLPYSAR
jgi:hypothetical protein